MKTSLTNHSVPAIIISIDPSLSCPGYCVYNSMYNKITYGQYKTNPKDSTLKRLNDIEKFFYTCEKDKYNDVNMHLFGRI